MNYKKLRALLFVPFFIYATVIKGGILKSVIYDFDGLDIGQTNLPEGDYKLGDLSYLVASNPISSNDMLGDRVLRLNINWSSGSGSFGRGISRYIELDPNADVFNFYFYNPISNNQTALFDIIITEDDDQSLTFDYSTDDQWAKNLSIAGSGGWQLVSIPVKDFVDSNTGGNGIFDATFTGNKGMVLQVEFRFAKPNSSAANPSFYVDMIALSDGPLPTGNTIFELPSKQNDDYCLLGAFKQETEGQEYLIPEEIENLFPAAPVKKLKYVNFFYQFAMDGSTTAKKLPGNEIKTLLDNGYRPIITLEPMFQGYDRLHAVQPRLNNIISGNYDSYFDAFADKLKSFDDTVIIRYMHEFEGNWYSWSLTENGQDPSLYISAFRHTVDRFRARGATKIKWMWCMNGDYAPYRYYNFAVNAYPGDSYVDIVATDIYNAHYPVDLPWWMSFRYKAAESYYYLTKYFSQKPLFICEEGSRERHSGENTSSQTKAQWIEKLDKELQSNFHKVRGLVFFNATHQEDWQINSSSASLTSHTNNIWNDDYYFKIATPPVPTNETFAVIGDYGLSGPNEAAVSNLVKSWNPGFIITLGDNNYELGESSTIDANVGQYYHEFIFPYAGSYGSGADSNRFFPALGNHDISTNNGAPYIQYFTLLGNERYYDYIKGNVHFFVLNSNPSEVDGADSSSTQALWLKNKLQTSTSKWNIVYFHHSPYCSDADHGSQAYMQWPFKSWGAHVVLSAHSHVYERLLVDGLPYFVVGVSGKSVYSFKPTPLPESVFRYSSDFGAMICNEHSDTLTFRFYNKGGALIDSYLLTKTQPAFNVVISSPSNNSVSSYGSPITINAVVTGGVGGIKKVEFFSGLVKLGSDSIYPYSFSWTNAQSGNYSLTANAIDNLNDTASSAPINISVVNSSTINLISSGSSWKYLDTGSNQGTAWRAPGFNDSGWKTGNAELGYGDGGEATLVKYGSSSTNKYITTYFRKTFNVSDASSVTALDLSIIRDDGAVVYLNGTEVFRTNMPGGAISYTTLAPVYIDGSGESTYVLKSLSPGSLLSGSNTIAVEIHQQSKTSSDISFNLKLVATTGAVSPCETPSGLSANSITSTSANLNWSVVSGATNYNVQYRKVGTSTWTTVASATNTKSITDLTVSSNYEFHVSSVCSSTTSSYSSISSFTTSGLTYLVSAGSPWKYLDNGSNQGTGWRSMTFNDSGWKTGNAELGYGDGGEATVVSYGPSSSNKYITTYFRKTFNIIDKTSITSLELSLIRDDGAVVYINGTEVYRTNLPSGTIYYNTVAPTYIDGANESAYQVVTINSSSLLNGNNVIAVEMHQNANTSSDISFNLKLRSLSGGARITAGVDTTQNYDLSLTEANDMIVYPNPNTGNFTLEFCFDNVKEESMKIEVFNSLGQSIYKKQAQQLNGCIKEIIELNGDLTGGVYILKISSKNKLESSKIFLTK